MSGPIVSLGGKWNGQTCGEILLAHVYRNEGKRRCGLLPGLVLFKLVAPALQLRVVAPYPIWGAWFPSHLLIKGIGGIQNYGS
jgi:hypothetical protein